MTSPDLAHRQFCSESDIKDVKACSRRLAYNPGDFRMSSNELRAAAIINRHTTLLADEDYRLMFIAMGRDWSHAVVEAIFDHWLLEMQLPQGHPDCPVGSQRIVTRPRRKARPGKQ